MFACRGGRSIKPRAVRGGSSAIPPAGASAKGPVIDLAISRAGICSTSVLPLSISNGGLMVREVKLRQVGGSVGATLPKDMADRITSTTERGLTTLVDNIDHIDSQSLNGVAVVKLYFRPSANLQTALAQVTAVSQTFLRFLPPGTTPPLVIQYSASSVPILQVGLSSTSLMHTRAGSRAR